MKEPSTKCHKAWVFLSMALAALCAIYATYTQVSHKRLRVKYDRAIAQGESLEKDLERQREQTELRQRDYLRVLDLLEAIDSAKKYEKMQQISRCPAVSIDKPAYKHEAIMRDLKDLLLCAKNKKINNMVVRALEQKYELTEGLTASQNEDIDEKLRKLHASMKAHGVGQVTKEELATFTFPIIRALMQ